MNKLAETYLKCEKRVLENLMQYYNENCVELVNPERRYEIKSGDNWCAMFTSVVAHLSGVVNFPYEVSVFEQVKIAKTSTQYRETIAGIKINDLIIFDWDGKGFPDHVGIVCGVSPNLIKTIEGNKGGSVNYRTTKKESEIIMGYISL